MRAAKSSGINHQASRSTTSLSFLRLPFVHECTGEILGWESVLQPWGLLEAHPEGGPDVLVPHLSDQVIQTVTPRPGDPVMLIGKAVLNSTAALWRWPMRTGWMKLGLSFWMYRAYPIGVLRTASKLAQEHGVEPYRLATVAGTSPAHFEDVTFHTLRQACLIVERGYETGVWQSPI
jgi:hypothetical protein